MGEGSAKDCSGQGQRSGRILKVRGLAWKTFRFTFPVILFIVLATQFCVGYFDYLDQIETYTNRTRLIAQLTAEALSRPVWNLDRSVFKSQIRAIAHDAGFRHARLIDDKGRLLFQLGRKPASSRVIRVMVPVAAPGGGKPIARFELYMSSQRLVDNAYRQVLISLAAMLVLLAGFLLTLQVTFRRLVKKPLDSLLEAMSRVERKDWQKVDCSSDDELGRLGAAFNRMVDALRSGDEAQRLLARLEVAQKELVEKNAELSKANRLILESIHYARRIQEAMLPDKKALSGVVRDIQVCWDPLQLVGGDYFWLERFGDKSLLAVMDCTGHGVPGAFMTLVVASALDNILHVQGLLSPAAILKNLDEMVRSRLRQDHPDSDSDDGLEAAICVWDAGRHTLTFAGAGLPLLYAQGGEIREIKGDRAALGYRSLPPCQHFSEHTVEVEPGMAFYLFTDGVPDQMGGRPPRLLGRRRLARIISPLLGRPMAWQLERVQEELSSYRGDQSRRDDMTLLGFVPC